MNLPGLTASDVKVLKLLQNDCDQPRAELAEAAGMSSSTFWRRVQDLEQKGAIRKRVALLDPDVVGMPVCVFLSVNMVNHEVKTRERFETFVSSTPEIMECYSVTGGADYILKVRAKSVSDFERFLMETILGNNSVASASSQISLRQLKYSTEIPI